MNYPKLVWVSILLAIVGSGFELTAFTQAPKRNLSEYKRGPACHVDHEYGGREKHNQDKAPCRQFLWENWTSRTKAYVSVTDYTLEGEPLPSSFFIEPNKEGKWEIRQESRYVECPYTSKAKCREVLRTVYSLTYDVIERIEPGYNKRDLTAPQIPDYQTRAPLEFELVFKNTSGTRRVF